MPALIVLIAFLKSSALYTNSCAAPLNESKILYSQKRDKLGRAVCTGEVDPTASVPPTFVKLIKTGIPCRSFDLDGSGYTDFIFFVGEGGESYALVLLFKGSKIVDSQAVAGELKVFEMNDPDRRRYPDKAKVFSVIKKAEDDRALVLFFDSKTKKFEKEEYVYSNGRKEDFGD